MTSMGKNVKAVRLKMHLSQEDFGKIIDSGKSYVSSVENDRSKLSVENLVKLLVDYNVNVNFILAGIGEPFLKQATKYEDVKADILEEVKEMLRGEGLIK